MIDSHCHLTSKRLIDRVEEVVENANRVGVHTLVTVATNGEDALAAQAVAEQFERVYFSSGVHPLYADGDWNWSAVLAASRNPKCVAWGELGLDRHYENPDFAKQRQLLEDQLALIEGQKGDLRPIIVHCRKAVDDLLPIFESTSFEGSRFVFHCFTEGVNEVKRILDFGAMVSFTGIVTYQNALQVVDAAKLVPINRMMVETDAPYLTPEPVRKEKSNEPKNVVYTASFLAALHGLSIADFESKMDENTTRFFNISSG